MNELIKAGGPAFPSHGTMGEVVFHGMTLRDYFAAASLQGMLSNTQWEGEFEDYAADAYSFADAMLKAREAQS